MVGTQTPRSIAMAAIIVFAFIFDDDRILLIERSNEPFKGQRTIPGGHKKAGETLRQACAREMKEETGLLLRHMDFAGILHTRPLQTGSLEYVSHYFVCHDFSGELCASDEGDLLWVPVKDIASPSKMPEKLHPAFKALFPFIINKNYPFEGTVVMDAAGEGDYVVHPPRIL